MSLTVDGFRPERGGERRGPNSVLGYLLEASGYSICDTVQAMSIICWVEGFVAKSCNVFGFLQTTAKFWHRSGQRLAQQRDAM